jgi:hypothetical protein
MAIDANVKNCRCRLSDADLLRLMMFARDLHKHAVARNNHAERDPDAHHPHFADRGDLDDIAVVGRRNEPARL